MHNDKSKFKEEFYQRLVRFSISVIEMCKEFKTDSLLWSISDQIIRSSTSVGANVMEAKSSSSKREYIKYFEIALKSANETIYWFDVIKEIRPTDSVIFLQKECSEIAAIIAKSVIKMKERD